MTNFSLRIALLLIAIYYWGYVLSDTEIKIVGGRNISILEAPHAVAIFLHNKNGKISLCGSAVLLNNVLLTAAHCCFEKFKPFGIVAGETKVDGNVKFLKEVKIIIHEKYTEAKFGNDIAIIKLQKPLILGSNIKRIAIMKDPPHASKGTVAGWGRTQIGKPHQPPYLLKSASMQIFNHEQCLKKAKQIPHGSLCSSAMDDPAQFGHASKGDSGSALLIDNLIAIGLVSYGPGTGYKDMGIVFTNVTYHYDWIVSRVEEVVCDEGSIMTQIRSKIGCKLSKL